MTTAVPPSGARPASGRAITCPSCGGTIAVKAAGYTVSLACQYCGTLLDVANPDVRIIAQYHQAVAQLDLPLGSRGRLFDVEWEVIGWLARDAAGYAWQEYLLFNPYAGYRWLVETGAQWQFGLMLTGRPQPLSADAFGWAGRQFVREDDPVIITTRRVLGEFYWRVRAGDTVTAESFACDGQSLSLEQSDGDVQWTHLVPVPPGWIAGFVPPQGADLAHPTPPRSAPDTKRGLFDRLGDAWAMMPGANESDVVMMAGVGLAVAMVALLILTALGTATSAASGRGSVVVDGATARFTLGTITVARPRQFVSVKVQADDFRNQWVDLDYTLVNRATQTAIPASATVEYYAGQDSDGYWSEGGHDAATSFAGVPAGQYDLIVDAQAHNWSDPKAGTSTTSPTGNPWSGASEDRINLAVLLEAGGMPWGLWWLIVALIALPPVAVGAYRASKTA